MAFAGAPQVLPTAECEARATGTNNGVRLQIPVAVGGAFGRFFDARAIQFPGTTKMTKALKRRSALPTVALLAVVGIAHAQMVGSRGPYERGVIPDEIAARIPDASGVVFPTLDELVSGQETIVNNWDTVVGADVQAAP